MSATPLTYNFGLGVHVSGALSMGKIKGQAATKINTRGRLEKERY